MRVASNPTAEASEPLVRSASGHREQGALHVRFGEPTAMLQSCARRNAHCGADIRLLVTERWAVRTSAAAVRAGVHAHLQPEVRGRGVDEGAAARSWLRAAWPRFTRESAPLDILWRAWASGVSRRDLFVHVRRRARTRDV